LCQLGIAELFNRAMLDGHGVGNIPRIQIPGADKGFEWWSPKRSSNLDAFGHIRQPSSRFPIGHFRVRGTNPDSNLAARKTGGDVL